MPRKLLAPLLLLLTPLLARGGEWRDMLRDYVKMRDAGTDCRAQFPGFDADMARLGEAFAKTAYPKHVETGRKNFKRLALKLRLTNPDADERVKLLVPNKTPWEGYQGPVDSDGLVHFVYNTGTLPMPILSHPIVRIVLRSDVSRNRVKPAAAIAARIIREEGADISLIENDAASREALLDKIRKAFDAENPDARMSDDERRCLAECLPYMV